MATRTEQVTIELRAKDQTGEAYNSAKDKLEKFVHESRSSARLLEHLLRGGGTAILASMVSEAMTKAGEAIDKYTEALDHAANAQAVLAATGALGVDLQKSIPVYGQIYSGVEKLVSGLEDLNAEQLKLRGFDDEEVDRHRSVEGFNRHYVELLKDTTAAYKGQNAALNALLASGGRTAGFNTDVAAVGEASRAAADHVAELVMQLKQYRLAHPNPDQGELDVEATMGQTIKNAAKAGQTDVANLKEQQKFNEQEFQRGRRADIERGEVEHNIKMKDQAAAAAADRLRQDKRDFEAESLLRKQALDDELTRSRAAEDEALRKQGALERQRQRQGKPLSPEEKDEAERRIVRNAEAERSAAKAASAEAQATAQKTEDNRKLDEQEQRRHTMAAIGIDLLRQQGEMGNKAAATSARMLMIDEKYASKREEINRLLREGHDISAQERARLQDALAATDALEAAEQKRESRGIPGPQTSPFSTGAELKYGQASQDSFAAATRQREQDQRRLQEKELDAVLKSNGFLGQIVAEVKSLAGKFGLDPAKLGGG